MTSNCPVKVAKRKSWRFWQLGGNRWQSWNRWARVLGFGIVVQEAMKAFGSGRKIHRSNLVLGWRMKNSMAFQGRQVSFESFIPLNFRAAPQHAVQFLPVVSAMQVLVLLRAFAVLVHDETLILALDLVPLFALSLSEQRWHWPYCFGLSSVGDTFSSNAVLIFSLFFTDEAPFLHASGKQWGHDGSWNLTFAIAYVTQLCLCKLQRESFQVL